MRDIPRPEHPRPSFFRESWENLNGEWEFCADPGASGEERKFYLCDRFDSAITVPFCKESPLSGIGDTDFCESVWYAKNIDISESALGGRVLFHVGACDHRATVYVNGVRAGAHSGGYSSFTLDITDSLKAGKNRVVIHAEDHTRNKKQPCGKQSQKYSSYGCFYTRTTGIWQTVWLEFVPDVYMERVKVTSDDLDGTVILETTLNKYCSDAVLRAEVYLEGSKICSEEYRLSGRVTTQTLKVSPVVLWEPGKGNIYRIRYTLLKDGSASDIAEGYFGIRRIDIDGYRVLINGKPVFQRLILDQGFYPDGIYTAPSDEILRRDIELSMSLGFNGARLHQKVFEERYLYHADMLGYLVWGEFPSWGIDISDPAELHAFLPEWLECVKRDEGHPSIIGWCPYNETWDEDGRAQCNTNISLIYDVTKACDPTRPVIDTSGNYHTAGTDIYDIHDYCGDPEIFRERYRAHAEGKFFETFPDRQKYDGKLPFFVSEYGGIFWSGCKPDGSGWGYGDAPKSEEEFCDRYCGLTNALMSAGNICGFCYTQLTDVEQEQNGLYRYDRSKKLSDASYERIRAVNSSPAEIEKIEK